MVVENCATLDLELESEIREFGDRLREWGYADVNIGEIIGKPGCDSPQAEDLCLLLHEISDGSPLGAMIRLFLLGFGVEKDQLDESVGNDLANVLNSIGVVHSQDGRVLAKVKIRPYQNLLCAFDPPTKVRTSDYVMGPAQSSVTLAKMTVRRPVRRALDLGCGCGVQALLAAGHSDRVVAVDTNPRAVVLSQFNAFLNRADNIDVRIADMFSSIDDEPFDLVVTNPPFVISPETTHTYRDSSLMADGVVTTIAEKVGSMLEPGGYCSIICDWAHVADIDWRERIKSWFSKACCDVWALRYGKLRPEAYASTWIGQTETGTIDDLFEKHTRWMDYYREQEIEQIDSGLLIIRKRKGGVGWFEVREAPATLRGPCGTNIERFFAIQDWLLSLGGVEGLLEVPLKLSPRTELKQQFKVTDHGWEIENSTLRVPEGLAYEGVIETVVVESLPAFNGKRSVGLISEKLADAIGSSTEDLKPDILRVVRAMLEQEVLDPV